MRLLPLCFGVLALALSSCAGYNLTKKSRFSYEYRKDFTTSNINIRMISTGEKLVFRWDTEEDDQEGKVTVQAAALATADQLLVMPPKGEDVKLGASTTLVLSKQLYERFLETGQLRLSIDGEEEQFVLRSDNERLRVAKKRSHKTFKIVIGETEEGHRIYIWDNKQYPMVLWLSMDREFRMKSIRK